MQAFDPADIQRLETLLASAKRVSVVVHTHPDGDAVGSGAGMLSYLRQCRGLDARLLLPDSAPASLAFALPADGVIDAARDAEAARAWIAGSDLLVCQDLNGFSRAGDSTISIGESFRYSPLAWIIHVADEAATFMLDRGFPET